MSTTPEPVFVWENGVLHPVSYDPEPEVNQDDEAEVNQDDEDHERRTLATDAEVTQLLQKERLYRKNAKLQDVIMELESEIKAGERARRQQDDKHREELQAKDAEINRGLEERIELRQINARQGWQLTAYDMYERDKANAAHLVQQSAVPEANGNNANGGAESLTMENSRLKNTVKELGEKLLRAEKAAVAMREHFAPYVQKSERHVAGFQDMKKALAAKDDQLQKANSRIHDLETQLSEFKSTKQHLAKSEELNVMLRYQLQRRDEREVEE
ncbi:hypothetical protein E8E14_003014 [Neopestalotiopsis sp. 37M]|nr:hypothetical protein E8E14_003014 [Neopestalotiopsis sp. 37M]